jgi:putative phosphoserine phosphatase/1-acylglycerol-3-phosphate O-acyltransferase
MRDSRLHAELTRDVHAGPSGPKVGAFFDLDQTLVAGFSAVAFVRERLLSGRLAPRDLAEMLVGAASFGLGRTGFSGFMTASTSMFRGLSVAMLEELGEQVFQRQLAGAIYPESRALVNAHREKGHTLAIVSSATRFQAEPLARALRIPHVLCTQLEERDGVFTGSVVKPTCYREGKALAAGGLADELGLELPQSYFYTDAADDLPLLEVVGNPRPLNPDRALAEIAAARGWPVRRFTSRGTPGAVDLARTGLALGSALTSVLVGLPAGVVSGSRRRAVNIATSTWGELGTAFAGLDLRVAGEEHLWSARPCVFIFNHQSRIDALLICKLLRRDTVGVAEQELRRGPFGPVLELAGTVFIDRLDRAAGREALEPALRALREGLSIALPPEGTRSRTPRLGRFKKGAFQIARAAGVPIVPIVFRNTLDALPKNAWVIRPATVEAVVHAPISTEGWTDETLADEIDAIHSLYRETLGQ